NQKRPSESEEDFRTRCLAIKEERADMVKHHLWVLWTDYFKPEHLEAHPDLHDTFWKATKAAGDAKKSQDPEQGKQLLALIDQVAEIFWATRRAAYPRRIAFERGGVRACGPASSRSGSVVRTGSAELRLGRVDPVQRPHLRNAE